MARRKRTKVSMAGAIPGNEQRNVLTECTTSVPTIKHPLALVDYSLLSQPIYTTNDLCDKVNSYKPQAIAIESTRTYAEVLQKPAPRVQPLSSPPSSNTTLDSSWFGDSDLAQTLPSSSISSDQEREQQTQQLRAEKEALEEEASKEWLLAHTMVDTDETLQDFLSIVDMVEDYDVDIFIDAEGGNGHGRDSNLNFVQVKLAASGKAWLLDVKKLDRKIFDTPSLTGKRRTFRQILEDDNIPTVLFDTRVDSDSFYGHFKVHLKGVIDLQVMESATRLSSRERLHSLDRCIESLPQSILPLPALRAWNKTRRTGKLCCSGPDGYGAFDIRPIPKEL
ncbi:hypothetical protein EG329_008041 [Mollisiaceae sp. DMI_Dod_QoI]|nr:hypothetical protein EG329_008041 [Helotiales sp. DMI_Dod_QoI]